MTPATSTTHPYLTEIRAKPAEFNMCTSVEPQTFELAAYAKKYRYRLRNLHDGGPVPPAKPARGAGGPTGYIGATERMDAIVGSKGYVTMDGNELSVCLFHKNALGINRAVPRLEAIGARIDQIGDTELGATFSVEHIDEVLQLIKASRLRPPNQGSFRPGTEPALSPESRETVPDV